MLTHTFCNSILVHVHVLRCASQIREKKSFNSTALRNPTLSYTVEYINPWLTFNSDPITAIVNILSSRTMTLAFFSFSLLVYVEENLKQSACRAFLEHSYHLHTSLLRTALFQSNTHKCALQHLAHLMLIKNVPHISVLLWYKPQVAQPCSLFNRTSHTNRMVETITVLTSQPVTVLPVPIRFTSY